LKYAEKHEQENLFKKQKQVLFSLLHTLLNWQQHLHRGKWIAVSLAFVPELKQAN
jgi:hypothetical protein